MKYIINSNATLRDALVQMDEIHQGFLVVVNDEKKHLYGTLTDGDIRRALIAKSCLEETVGNVCNKRCHKLVQDEGLVQIIDHFKNKAISFLPVVDKQGKVVNLLTKKQLHSLLLTNNKICLLDDFSNIDESLMDYEIYPRPWGFYKTVLINQFFQLKIISIAPGQALSLQLHNLREEYWIVAHGKGIARIEKSELYVQRGTTLFIPKGCKHRLKNIDEQENLIITEIQIGEYFGEDDITRFEDIYGRI